MIFNIGDSKVVVETCVLDSTTTQISCLDFLDCPYDAYEGCRKCPFGHGKTVRLEEIVSVYLEVYNDAHNR